MFRGIQFRRLFHRILPLFALIALTGALAALAQVPDEFTNLKVFPKDVGKMDLIGVMKEFNSALGVKCHHCHEMKTPGDFNSIDWASDAMATKDEARGMMRMVGQLNNELVPRAMGKPVQRVRCITCHRGLADPRTLDLVLLETIGESGAEAGVEHYKALKDEHYGSGSYDFGSGTLIDVATTLAQNRGDTAGAMKVLELNAANNPDDSRTYLMMSQIQILTGDKDGAMANAQKALELDPENAAAAQILEQFGGGADGQ